MATIRTPQPSATRSGRCAGSRPRYHAQRAGSANLPREARGMGDRRDLQVGPECGIVEQTLHRRRKIPGRGGVAVKRGPTGDFDERRAGGRHDRAPGRHGFEHGQSEPLDDGREHEGNRAVQEAEQFCIVHQARERDEIAHSEITCQLPELIEAIAAAGDDEPYTRPPATALGKCPERRRNVLVGSRVPQHRKYGSPRAGCGDTAGKKRSCATP